MTEYRNFMEAHAKPLRNRMWQVTSPIHAFKRIRTYPGSQNANIIVRPHRDEEGQKLDFAQFYANRFSEKYWTAEPAIANLIVPVGAEVHIDLSLGNRSSNYGKLRASEAIVHSVVRKVDKKPVAFGVSGHDENFVYLNGLMLGREIKVTPNNGFSSHAGTCNSGIHFFLELQKALRY